MTGTRPSEAPPYPRAWHSLLLVLALFGLAHRSVAQKPVTYDLSIRFEGLDTGKQKYLDGVLRAWDPAMFLSISVALQEARVGTRRTINAQELGEQLAPYGITVIQITDTTGEGLHGPGGGHRHASLPGTRVGRAELMDQATPAHGDR